MENGIKQFEVGKAYYEPFGEVTLIGTVIKRTAKTVTVDIGYGEIKTCRVKIVRDEEWIYPLGRGYSMAPAIDASHIYLGIETERKLNPLWDFDHRESAISR